MPLILRSYLDRKLTSEELDSNFTYLEGISGGTSSQGPQGATGPQGPTGPSGGGGSGNPTGSNNSVQYNNNGEFGADDGFVRDGSTGDFLVEHNSNGTSLEMGDGIMSGILDGLSIIQATGSILQGIQVGFNNITESYTSTLARYDVITDQLATFAVNDDWSVRGFTRNAGSGTFSKNSEFYTTPADAGIKFLDNLNYSVETELIMNTSSTSIFRKSGITSSISMDSDGMIITSEYFNSPTIYLGSSDIPFPFEGFAISATQGKNGLFAIAMGKNVLSGTELGSFGYLNTNTYEGLFLSIDPANTAINIGYSDSIISATKSSFLNITNVGISLEYENDSLGISSVVELDNSVVTLSYVDTIKGYNDRLTLDYTGVSFYGPTHSYTFPHADGGIGEVMMSDGANGMFWATPTTGYTGTFSPSSVSDIVVVNGVITNVIV